MLANALYGYGYAFGDADPVRALEALRRGLVIAQDSGNRLIESLLATALSRLETEHGDPLAALDHITLAIRNFYDSGNVAYIRFSLATLAVLLDRLGRLEPAATIAGFAFSPLAAAAVPQLTTAIAHLRDVARRPDLRIACPQRRDDDHLRSGDLRIRPDRPGSSRTEDTLEIELALNRSVHRLGQVSRSLSPEDGIGSVVEIVEQVLDLSGGVHRVVAVVFQVLVAPVQRP